MSVANKFTGKNGSIVVAGNTHHVTSWEAEVTAEAVDVTDSSSGSYREFIQGLVTGTLTADFVYNAATPPHGFGILRGVTAVFTGTMGDAGDTISGSVLFTSVRYRTPIEGRVEFSINGQFTGSITEPAA